MTYKETSLIYINEPTERQAYKDHLVYAVGILLTHEADICQIGARMNLKEISKKKKIVHLVCKT